MLTDATVELENYGNPLFEGSKRALLLQIITRFSNAYREVIDGKLTDLSLSELSGGARINYIFNEVFGGCLVKVDPIEELSDEDIRTAIQNATGPKAALFIPDVAFELLLKSQVRRLEEPSLQCVEFDHDELQRIVSQLETKDLIRFTKLRESIVDTVYDMINKYRSPTKEMIEN